MLSRMTMFVAFLWLVCTPLSSQETFPVKNLELANNLASSPTSRIHCSGKWLSIKVYEGSQGKDLNGDGDAIDEILHVHDLEAGETHNLGLAAFVNKLSSSWLAFPASEPGQGVDLNGDGDKHDGVLHVRELEVGETTNLGFTVGKPVLSFPEYSFEVSGKWVAFALDERWDGDDHNGDGDTDDDDLLHVRDLETGETTNLGPVFEPYFLWENWLAFQASELARDEDLNGDGDTKDYVLHVRDLEAGDTTNVGLAGYPTPPSGGWLAFGVKELSEGEDLNGDGDTRDSVHHVRHLATGETTNLGLALAYGHRLSERWFVFQVFERDQGEDLNGDGDTEDNVIHVRDLDAGTTVNLRVSGYLEELSGNWLSFTVVERSQAEDLNGDGDTEDRVLHVCDLEANETTNLVSADTGPVNSPTALSQAWIAFSLDESTSGEDLNGDGDAEDRVLHTVYLGDSSALPYFVRGDCNDDGNVDISDAVRDFRFCFSGATVACEAACDIDGDGNPCTGVTDGVRLLMYLFRGGKAPPAPFPECGSVEEEVDCESPPVSCQ